MTKEIKSILRLFFILFLGTTIAISCESDPDELGTQFFQNGTAQGTEVNYDVIAYNVFNNDIIEADNDKLTEATLGVFDESNFGMQKSSYVTQVRLSAYNPDFGANPVVDSVVLQMKPQYYTVSDSVKTPTTVEDYIHPENIPAKKVVTNYPIKKYGKAKRPLTIKVHEVTDFLNSIETSYNSNQQVTLGTLLGTKIFDGFVRSIKITKDSDNSELLSREAALRISLEKDFFTSKIINKKGSDELKDAASFIRYFKGLKISVLENDGYIFNFNPNEVTTTIYYKHDKSATDNTRVEATYTLDLGSTNVHFNQIEYNRPSAYTAAMSSINTTTGDPKLYLQSMGGSGAEIVIPDATIAQLRTLYKNEKIGILSAKIRLYTDASVWNNNYAKPNTFTTLFKTLDSENKTIFSFFTDKDFFAFSGAYKMVNAVDLDKNPAYYEIGITQSIKNMVEKEETPKPISINVGSFQSTSNGGLLGVDFTSKAYTPHRIVLVGSDPNNSQNKAQLKIIYSKK